MENNNVLKDSSLLNPDIRLSGVKNVSNSYRKVIGFEHHSFVFRRDRSYHLRRFCPIEFKYCFDGVSVFRFGYHHGRVHYFKTPIYE